MKCFVYILKCRDNSFYTGITNDPQKRFKEHVSGKGGRYTRSHRPVKMVYLEKTSSRSKALKRESRIKKMTRQKKTALIKVNWKSL
jgi:putative endonuclease